MAVAGKKLMVLGAGVYQVAGIRRAVAKGAHVITVDYLPDNIGHRLSHAYENASTTDREAVLAAARRCGIDGIVTFASDPAAPTVAYVAHALGLPGVALEVAETMSDKAAFRRAQRAHGLAAPAWAAGRSAEAIAPEVAGLTGPLIVKPVDSSGSRGVVRVDPAAGEDWRAAFAHALGFSRSGFACVEELVPGIDVSADGFFVGGRLAFVAFTRRYRRGYVVTGHRIPTVLTEDDQGRARAEIERTGQRLGYTDGPFDVDLVVSPERVVVIEISPRTGGNAVPLVIAEALGVDLHDATICHALGEPVALAPAPAARAAGAVVLGVPRDGVLEAIASLEQLRARVPEVIDYVVGVGPGDRVAAHVHGGAGLGYAVFRLSDESSYDEVATAVREAVAARVRP